MAQESSLEQIRHTIELDEKLDAHVRGWKLQRVSWSVMLLVILSALLGLCGNGPLSYRTKAVNGDTLKYEYFLRYESQAVLAIALQQQNGMTTIAFPSLYWKAFQVEKIDPEPADNRQVADSLYYLFKGEGKGHIRFFLKPQQRGSIEGGVSINQQPYSLSHFIYP